MSEQAKTLAAHHLKTLEGVRLTAYQDVGGVWTVGCGHVVRGCTSAFNISTYEAESLLMADINLAYAGINWLGLERLTEVQRAAVIIFVFNIGAGSFNRSGVRKILLDRKSSEAKIRLAWGAWRFVKSKEVRGLVNRRNFELRLFFGV